MKKHTCVSYILLGAQTLVSLISFTSMQLSMRHFRVSLGDVISHPVAVGYATALLLLLHGSGLSLEMHRLSSTQYILILYINIILVRVHFLLQCLASYCDSPMLNVKQWKAVIVRCRLTGWLCYKNKLFL